MKLYRIQQRSSKLFFYGFSPIPRKKQCPMFSETGAFYRKLDTVERNLKWLCSDELFGYSLAGGMSYYTSRRTVSYKHSKPKWDPKRLRNYQVVISDVTVNKSTTINASKLFGGNK